MTERKKVWLSGVTAGVVLTLAAGCGLSYLQYGVVPLVGESVLTGESGRKAAAIEQLVEENYLEEADEEAMADGMYAGMLASLEDPYSGYYTKENYQKLKESSEGKYTGIGLVLRQDSKTKVISVVRCYAGSPAAKAGIKEGDVICKIGEKSAADMNVTELSNEIKNGDTEEVVLGIQREGMDELLTVTVKRDVVEIPVVSSRMLQAVGEKKVSGKQAVVGYIQIGEFTDGTSQQFADAYKELLDQGAEGLLIDLRNNPGGLLTSVCDTLEQILPEGMIVYTEDKYGNREEHTCEGETPIDIPLVVLVNEESASASEIFAGAVKDHGVGTLVGTTTFGKGIVQKIYPMRDKSAVKLTVSKYYTPKGVNIHGTGITPDISAEWPEDQEPLSDVSQLNQLELEEWLEKDNQMNRAWEEILAQLVGKEEK